MPGTAGYNENDPGGDSDRDEESYQTFLRYAVQNIDNGNFAQADSLFELAYGISRGNPARLTSLYFERARAYVRTGLPEFAVPDYDKALELAGQDSDDLGQVVILLEKGRALQINRRLDEAIISYQGARDILESSEMIADQYKQIFGAMIEEAQNGDWRSSPVDPGTYPSPENHSVV